MHTFIFGQGSKWEPLSGVRRSPYLFLQIEGAIYFWVPDFKIES